MPNSPKLASPERYALEATAPNPGRWVRRMIAASPVDPLAPGAVWSELRRYAGGGPLGIGRTKDVLDYIGRELADRKGGLPMRSLWNAVAGYLAKIQEDLAAARRRPAAH